MSMNYHLGKRDEQCLTSVLVFLMREYCHDTVDYMFRPLKFTNQNMRALTGLDKLSDKYIKILNAHLQSYRLLLLKEAYYFVLAHCDTFNVVSVPLGLVEHFKAGYAAKYFVKEDDAQADDEDESEDIDEL